MCREIQVLNKSMMMMMMRSKQPLCGEMEPLWAFILTREGCVGARERGREEATRMLELHRSGT